MIKFDRLRWAALTLIAAFFFLKPGIIHNNALLSLIGWFFISFTISIILTSIIKKTNNDN